MPIPAISPHSPDLDSLRARIARLDRRPGTLAATDVLRFGVAAIDRHLPGGGLLAGALHEVAGEGADIEHGAAAALLLAGLLARRRGPVLWAVMRHDLFAPALAAAGLHPDRVVFAEAGRAVLLVMEEALRHPGLAGVVGEVGKMGLTASRRLQLAAEASGVTAFALRRFAQASDPALAEPNAAVTRWRVGALPSPPPLAHAPDVAGLAHAPDVAGLAPARWRLDLVRCRGGTPASWTVEACDAEGRLRLVADIGDRQAAPGGRAAGGSAAGDAAA
jgi:protein ImuA